MSPWDDGHDCMARMITNAWLFHHKNANDVAGTDAGEAFSATRPDNAGGIILRMPARGRAEESKSSIDEECKRSNPLRDGHSSFFHDALNQ